MGRYTKADGVTPCSAQQRRQRDAWAQRVTASIDRTRAAMVAGDVQGAILCTIGKPTDVAALARDVDALIAETRMIWARKPHRRRPALTNSARRSAPKPRMLGYYNLDVVERAQRIADRERIAIAQRRNALR